jgi:hypothetical protein
MRIRKQPRKQKGQAILLIALALVALIALVALAVDGGNAYNQRRIAQNSVDGATHAAMTELYRLFMIHRLDQNTGQPNCNPSGCTMSPITDFENQQLLQKIKDTLAASGYGNAATDPNHYGIDTNLSTDTPSGNLVAYYINSNGNRITSAQVGTGPVQWADRNHSDGMTGIWISTTATAPTYFARLIGQNQVRSDAHESGKLQSISSITDAQQYRHTRRRHLDDRRKPLERRLLRTPPDGQQGPRPLYRVRRQDRHQ